MELILPSIVPVRPDLLILVQVCPVIQKGSRASLCFRFSEILSNNSLRTCSILVIIVAGFSFT